MASFIVDLFQSIFIPGPTPVLLIATNVTFALLQALLLLLLIATYSIHFIILSLLSLGLWIAINWFANEMKMLQIEKTESKSSECDGCLSATYKEYNTLTEDSLKKNE
ncbi:V-type ATPase assembly factor PKR1 [Erysiphe necator]|nr:V-type ATPase assembly factor PKR1 [Erysiphe necator]